MTSLQYSDTAAAGYDEGVGCMTRLVAPTTLRMSRLSSGLQVLDVAAGTGIASETAATIVGPAGHVTAADISPAMLEQARKRLSGLGNVTITVEDGTKLTFPEAHFDRVICNMGLMYFPDAARGVSEFYRVLRPGGRAAAAVFGTAKLPFLSVVYFAIESVASQEKGMGAKLHALGENDRLGKLFEVAGFVDVEIGDETLHLKYPSFEAYLSGVEKGAGAAGQAYMALPEDQRLAVREDVRRRVGDKGGTLDVDVAIKFASGRKGLAPAPTTPRTSLERN
jgi:SAM-dependent methyltransferase